jgi:hypothetical protein
MKIIYKMSKVKFSKIPEYKQNTIEDDIHENKSQHNDLNEQDFLEEEIQDLNDYYEERYPNNDDEIEPDDNDQEYPDEEPIDFNEIDYIKQLQEKIKQTNKI